MEERAGLIEIHCLGSLRVSCGEREVRPADWRKTKASSLFKFLLAHRRAWVPVEMLLEAFWPEMDLPAALQNFRVTLYHARRALADAVPASGKQGFAIEYSSGRCRLRPERLGWVDADCFAARVQEGWSLVGAGRLTEAAVAFAQADALYQGDFLAEDPYAEWLHTEREHLRHMELAALEWLAGYWDRSGEPGRAIACARRALTLDPLREEMHRILMASLIRAGRRAEALDQYRRCRRLLFTELGIFPSPETDRIIGSIVPHGAASAGAATAGD